MPIRKKALAKLALFLSACVLQDAAADTAQMVPRRSVHTETFGDVQITQVYDTLTPESWELSVKVTKGDKLILYMRDALFEQFFASPNKRLFVGLSNSGWPGSAILVFDADGHIYTYARHSGAFEYCQQTSTLLKYWYYHKKPAIEFPNFETDPPKLTIKGCRGNKLDILELATKVDPMDSVLVRETLAVVSGSRPRKVPNSKSGVK
jgi:hypothetical protein